MTVSICDLLIFGFKKCVRKVLNCEKEANMSAAFKTMMPSSVLLTWAIAILPASNFGIINGGNLP